ncbi:MAG TPA: FlgD immunoglobulin-like domain containing protein [Candidatus Acidoferrales bacterium]|nr:FlgD immunoglobulin-like domain containing protein [Candidatus Acidoferrales bacterium]
MTRFPLAPLVVLTLLLASGSVAAAAETRAFLFQTDYTTGSLSTSTLSPRTPSCDVASVNNDASMRYYGGRLYVVNRFGGDNVQVIDPATGGTLLQFSVGNGSNPHDIAFASATHAYVSRFDATDLWVVNPATGAHTGTISLASFADADGLPEMDRLEMVGPLLFVSIERLNRNAGYAPADTGLVAVVDTRADTLLDCDPARPGVQAIALTLRNPFTAFQWDPASDRLLIGCAGAFGALDGGIEWIDPVALKSAGVAITEARLGGDVDDVVWGDAGKSWAIVADLAGNTRLESWSASADSVLGTIWNPGGYVLADAELNDRGELWVCDNDFSFPKVRVFSAATDLPLGSDLLCTLPPGSVTFDATSGQIASVPATGATLALSPPSPNPASRSSVLAFSLPAAGEARLEVLDVAGRRVRTLASGARAAGPARVAWDLADDAGERVPAGLYWVRLAVAGEARVQRLIVIR